jgi:hypothetical protein
MRSLFPLVMVTGLVGLLGGCAPPSTALLRDRGWARPAGAVRVVVMPPDVELSELTAGGLLEPKAEWTERGRAHVATALARHLQGKGAAVVGYPAPAAGGEDEAADAQLTRLHDAVGDTILVHKYLPLYALPTKEQRFDWTLGTSVRPLQARTGADCALFVFFRDSYASAGRTALIVGAALVGVGVPGGRQVGFASLVDLRSGDVLWFNRLVSSTGDLRTPEPALKAVQSLLVDLPL